MSLITQQRNFALDLAKLLEWGNAHAGVAITVGEVERPPWVAAIYAQFGRGIVNSLHTERLAVDLNLYTRSDDGRWEYKGDSESYRWLGEFWKQLRTVNAWGGDFAKPDGRHFSSARGGRR